MSNLSYTIEERQDLTSKIDIYVCSTNQLMPYMPLEELGIVVTKGDIQVDLSIEPEDIDELIDFLTIAKKRIYEFNNRSKEFYKEKFGS